ncbi:MAG: hypothetical protein OXU81_23730 [Gammaproteobacteria bacterium]|nr:hypothetical protein [Gammaproteobacteria bacterium]
MAENSTGQAKGPATPYEQHLDLVEREKAMARREERIAEREKAIARREEQMLERAERVMAWAQNEQSAVAARQAEVGKREIELRLREIEVERTAGEAQREKEIRPISEHGTGTATHREETGWNAESRTALRGLAERLRERLVELNRWSGEQGRPSVTFHRGDEQPTPGMMLFELQWEKPGNTTAQTTPERRNAHVRVSQDGSYLEVGSMKTGFMEIEARRLHASRTMHFEVGGEELEGEAAVEKVMRWLLGNGGESGRLLFRT